MTISRNEFLKTLGVSATASLAGFSAFPQPRETNETSSRTATDLRYGLASYTLRTLSLDDVIKVSKRLGFSGVALKSMHMPLESSTEELKSIAEKFKEAGLRLYGAGVIYMKTAAEVENTFRYAVAAGLETIIGVPNHELLPMVNDLVKKHNIKLAIHNHGPGDDLYHSPSDVYEKIKSLDSRMGMCIDIGHVVRIGRDPVPMLEKYQDRLYDMHMKDVDKAVAEGGSVEIGRGVIDIPAVVKMLKKIKYQGLMAFEYEKDGDDPVPGLAESVGYVRGIARMV